jgi:hypothetical protein
MHHVWTRWFTFVIIICATTLNGTSGQNRKRACGSQQHICGGIAIQKALLIQFDTSLVNNEPVSWSRQMKMEKNASNRVVPSATQPKRQRDKEFSSLSTVRGCKCTHYCPCRSHSARFGSARPFQHHVLGTGRRVTCRSAPRIPAAPTAEKRRASCATIVLFVRTKRESVAFIIHFRCGQEPSEEKKSRRSNH